MNDTERRLTALFDPPTRFEVTSNPRAVQEAQFEALSTELLRVQLNESTGLETRALLRRAANESAALAWVTPYPTLVFPLLFEEKANQARRQAAKQAQVRSRSRALLMEAA
jgi:hypothetical protein